jgi:hypothetical protein
MKTKQRDIIDKKDNSLTVVAIISILIIIGLWLLTYYTLKDLQPNDRGSFGDMFGSVNALF